MEQTEKCNDQPADVKRSRGRPRAFDRTAALDQAMQVFWRKGYDAASIDDLTEAMAISRPSLYAAFGDKQALFGEALNHYGEMIGKPAQAHLMDERPIVEALTGFFEQALATATGKIKGCMAGSCAATLAETNQGLCDSLHMGACGTIKAFATRLQRAQSAGEISKDADCQARARLMYELLSAQSYRARVGFGHDDLERDIPEKVAAITR